MFTNLRSDFASTGATRKAPCPFYERFYTIKRDNIWPYLHCSSAKRAQKTVVISCRVIFSVSKNAYELQNPVKMNKLL